MKLKDANRLMISMSGFTYKEISWKLGVAGNGAVRGIGITNNARLDAWIRLCNACKFDLILKSPDNEYKLADYTAPLPEGCLYPRSAFLAIKAEKELSWAGVSAALGVLKSDIMGSEDGRKKNFSTDVMIRFAEACGYKLMIRFRETGEEFKLDARPKEVKND